MMNSSEIKNLQNKIQRLEAEIKAHQAAIREQLKYRKEDQEKIETLQSVIKNKSDLMDAWQEEIADLVAENKTLKEWNKDSLARRFDLKAKNKKLREALEGLYNNTLNGERWCQIHGLPRRIDMLEKAKQALKDGK